MSYIKPNVGSNPDNNKIEIIKNRALLFIKSFWKFSLFYGDCLASLHSRKSSKHRQTS